MCLSRTQCIYRLIELGNHPSLAKEDVANPGKFQVTRILFSGCIAVEGHNVVI